MRPLTDARTGQPFELADLSDRVVFVETMAVWCTNCKAQQGAAREAMATLDPARVVWIVLDVDPGEDARTLARYADENAFPFTYALAGADLSRDLADAFGAQVLSPPATPIIVLAPDGRVTLTEFGHKDAARLAELAREHGA